MIIKDTFELIASLFSFLFFFFLFRDALNQAERLLGKLRTWIVEKETSLVIRNSSLPSFCNLLSQRNLRGQGISVWIDRLIKRRL